MNIKEKASYVKGLIDGLELDAEAKETRALAAILDLLEDIAGSIANLEDSVDDVYDQLDDFNEDLAELEDEVFCDCSEDGKGEFYDIKCPACDKVMCVNKNCIGKDGVCCPNCDESFQIDNCKDDDCCLCDCSSSFSENE